MMSSDVLNNFPVDLSDCMIRDAVSIRQRLRKMAHLDESRRQAQWEKLIAQASESVSRVAMRRAARPLVTYPESLPVSQKAEDIRKAIADHQVVVIAGETGSGKTTQIPKICVELGRGVRGLIGHTQPRRLAARAVSARIAEELGCTLGETVGYQVRFTDQVGDKTLVKLMTDGILLAEIPNDPYLNRYDTLIIDEAHERSLNIDFLLGYLKTLLSKRPDLKLIITSATIDVERFSKHFDNAPVIEVSGRTYPVDIHYRPLVEMSAEEQGLNEAVLQVLDEINANERASSQGLGDVLVFLPGEREIRELAKFLKYSELRDTEVLPLYARLSASDQARIFLPHTGRRIVLSTNVAETSLTVPGIRYVIDPGLARVSRYSYRSKLQRLPVEAISQASANQRAGRCGRVSAGVCYRLYSEADYLSRPEFTEPEILRTNLASVILTMVDLGLGKIEKFPFVESPDRRLINDGFKLLFELGAVDTGNRLSPVGKQLAKFPVDPRIGRMLIEAVRQNCLTEMLIITSALSIQDPRDRPPEKTAQADQMHARFNDSDSDFVAFVNLWNDLEVQRQELSSSQFKKYCQKHYLSYLRVQEWRDVHRQLHLLTKDMKLAENASAANYDAVHKALLAGLLSNIGELVEKREYRGARNRGFMPIPGSAAYKKSPKWLVAGELIETSKVYGRLCARIDVAWVEPLATHILKRSFFEPHWEKKRAQVVAFERVVLYGLEIVAKRKMNYGKVAPQESREIFIRSALVEGEFQTKAPFWRHNCEQIDQVLQLEEKSRRRDILVDDETLYRFYDARIPPSVVSGTHFDSWWKSLPKAELKSLEISVSELMRHEASSVTPESFPDRIEFNGMTFPLEYHFAPGAENDGVTLTVPSGAVKQLSANRLDWLVPGLLREKCISLIKGLPRQLRKQLVPVPDVVDQVLPLLTPSDELLSISLGKVIRRVKGVLIPEDAWNAEELDAHLKLNIKVDEGDGQHKRQSRDLLELVDHYADADFSNLVPDVDRRNDDTGPFTQWSFDSIPAFIEVKQQGVSVRLIPVLEDKRQYVEKVLCTDELTARLKHRRGVSRLLLLQLKEQSRFLIESLPEFKTMALYFAPYGRLDDLRDDILMASVVQLAQVADDIRNIDEFKNCLAEIRPRFHEHTQDIVRQVATILKWHHKLMKQLKGKMSLALANSCADLKFQLEHLFYPGFIFDTPPQQFKQLSRYLNAADVRMEKMAREMAREREFLLAIRPLWERYEQRKTQLDKQGITDEALELYRWMLEEFRVSFFAQQLGTAYPISEKRLNKQWELVRK